jgi:Domain of unknown function (DUF6378)
MSIIDERAEHYGDPRPNMERTADLWTAYLGLPVSAHDVAICMMLVKISRSAVTHHADNYTDMRGYSVIAEALSKDR